MNESTPPSTQISASQPTAPSTERSISIADPGAIGLAAFALTTFMLSVFNAGILSPELEMVVMPVAAIYGGLVQIAAGIFELFRKNLFGALAFSSYGAFWISFVGVATAGLDPTAVGLFLLAWTIFTAYMTIVTFRINVGLMVTFCVLELTFIFLTVGKLAGLDIATTIGGWLGLLTAFAAWYCSFSGVINATWGRTVLPNKSLAKK